MSKQSKRDLRSEIVQAQRYFGLSGKRVTRLYPSHVNHTGRRDVSARTRQSKIDRSIKDYLPDNLFDLMVQ